MSMRLIRKSTARLYKCWTENVPSPFTSHEIRRQHQKEAETPVTPNRGLSSGVNGSGKARSAPCIKLPSDLLPRNDVALFEQVRALPHIPHADVLRAELLSVARSVHDILQLDHIDMPLNPVLR